MVISPRLLLSEDVEFETLIPSFSQSDPTAPKRKPNMESHVKLLINSIRKIKSQSETIFLRKICHIFLVVLSEFLLDSRPLFFINHLI